MAVSQEFQGKAITTSNKLDECAVVVSVAREIVALLRADSDSEDLIQRAGIQNEEEGYLEMTTALGPIHIETDLFWDTATDKAAMAFKFFHADYKESEEDVWNMVVDSDRNVLESSSEFGFTAFPESTSVHDYQQFIYYMKAALLSDLLVGISR